MNMKSSLSLCEVVEIKLVGIVDRENINELFMVKAALK